MLSYSRNTLVDSSLQEHLAYFEKKGVGIINASPTAMGLLTNNGPPVWHPASDKLKVAIAVKLSQERQDTTYLSYMYRLCARRLVVSARGKKWSWVS